jgi:hypothetical protein
VELQIQHSADKPTAVVIDGEFYFDAEIEAAASKENLTRTNPRFVAVRLIDNQKVRQSIVMIRQDVYPSEGQLSSVRSY